MPNPFTTHSSDSISTAAISLNDAETFVRDDHTGVSANATISTSSTSTGSLTASDPSTSESTFSQLEQVKQQLLAHEVYRRVRSAEEVRVFMRHHVFAVWDFMSLLKRLQQDLTSVQVPWMPRASATYARFINEIVLGEECDQCDQTDPSQPHHYVSHYELYLQAMREVGADTQPVERLLECVQSMRGDVLQALDACRDEIPPTARAFMQYTFSLALQRPVHEVAAAFFYGREDLIPDMFTLILQHLDEQRVEARALRFYLQRHIEVDSGEHGPLAQKLLRALCDGDPQKLSDVERVGKEALQHRIGLWDGVLQELDATR